MGDNSNGGGDWYLEMENILFISSNIEYAATNTIDMTLKSINMLADCFFPYITHASCFLPMAELVNPYADFLTVGKNGNLQNKQNRKGLSK